MQDRVKDQQKSDEISDLLDAFPGFPLVGLTSAIRKSVLIAQLIDSIRRIEYLRLTSARARSVSLYTPYSGSFQPFGGSAALHKAGRTDDAYLLIATEK